MKMGYLKYLGIYLVFILQILVSTSHRNDVPPLPWQNVRSISIIPRNSNRCPELCNQHYDCAMWIYNSSLSKCFLLSTELSAHTTKHYYNQITLDPSIQSGRGRPPFTTIPIIADLVPFDSLSLFNQQQHFSRSCKYTISAWVWLWKGPHNDGSERVIFSTRQFTQTGFTDLSALLPTVLFNIGHDDIERERLFFADSKDIDGLYSGFWPKEASIK